MGLLVSLIGWTIFMFALWLYLRQRDPDDKSTQKRRRPPPVVIPPVRTPRSPANDEHGPHGPPRYDFVHSGVSHNRYYPGPYMFKRKGWMLTRIKR